MTADDLDEIEKRLMNCAEPLPARIVIDFGKVIDEARRLMQAWPSCETCNGSGQVDDPTSPYTGTSGCPRCGGTGKA